MFYSNDEPLVFSFQNLMTEEQKTEIGTKIYEKIIKTIEKVDFQNVANKAVDSTLKNLCSCFGMAKESVEEVEKVIKDEIIKKIRHD